MFGDTFLADPSRAAERAHWRSHLEALPASIAECAQAVVLPRASAGRTDELPSSDAGHCWRRGPASAYGPQEAQAVAEASGGNWTVVVNQPVNSLALETPAAINALLRTHFAEAERRQAA